MMAVKRPLASRPGRNRPVLTGERSDVETGGGSMWRQRLSELFRSVCFVAQF